MQAPPVDAFVIAERLGIVVAQDELLPHRARYVRLSDTAGRPAQGAIVLGSEPRAERRQWAVAHEIGETLAAELFRSLDVDPRTARPGLREAVASALGGRLLLPGAFFFDAAAGCDWDLAALKERFATASHELIARRMLDGAVPVIVTVVDQGQCGFRRSNLPGRVPPPLPMEREMWRRVHETGGCADTNDAGQPNSSAPAALRARDGAARAIGELRLLRVQAWAIHEPPWEREILRSEMNAEQFA